MIKGRKNWRLNSASIIKKELKKKIKVKPIAKQLSISEKEFLQNIITITEEKNINNITRTMAYLDFFRKKPEIHWSFLAHMVSRNAGWNMTDLKGDLISNLLSKSEQQAFFSFLERGNWLIFQDAYPQLLLYEESRKQNKNLFYLLPHLNVSTFMDTIWNYFWENGDYTVLAISQIINEQSYIEGRLIQDSVFKESVLDTIEFKLQDFLSLNHILFPYLSNEKKVKSTPLMGHNVHFFSLLHERILLGKRLYSLLFSNNENLSNVFGWATQHPHTGSRKDYWPHLFNDIKDSAPSSSYNLRIEDCKLRYGKTRIYSPKLMYAWKNVIHKIAEKGDWFDDWTVIKYLSGMEENIPGKITKEYCETLEKIELAVLAKKIIM